MRPLYMSPAAAAIAEQQQRRQDHTDLMRLMRRVGEAETRMAAASVVGTAQDEYGGHSLFHWLAPDADFHGGVTDGTGRLFEWDKAAQIWQPTGEQKVIRSDFWQGFRFAGEPIVGLFSHMPGKMYAIGSGYTLLHGHTASGVSYQSYGTVTVVVAGEEKQLQAYGHYGDIDPDSPCGCMWDAGYYRWIAALAGCPPTGA